MKTRCKFVCVGKTETLNGYQIEMRPVTTGSPENETFFRFTPHGDMKIGLVSAETARGFVVGKQYYLDISPAD